MTTTDQTFEERLLRELRAVVRDNPAPAPVADRHRFRLTPARLTVGGAATTAAAVTLAVLLSGGSRPTPAYAVEPHSDGSVTVTIKSVRDADGLQRELRAAGVAAVVDYVPAGKACRQPRFERPESASGRQSMAVRTDGSGAATFTISRDQLRAGQTLVIEDSLGEAASSIGLAIADGPVAPCRLVDAPTPPAPPAGAVTDDGPSLNSTHEAPDAGPSTQSAGG
jgi:hypothetical protein